MGMITQDTARELAPANAWPGRGGPGPSARFVYADLLAAGKNGGPLLPGQRGRGPGLMEKGFLYAACFSSRGRYFELPHPGAPL